MDVQVGDILEMKSPIPAGAGDFWFCAPAWILRSAVLAAAMR